MPRLTLWGMYQYDNTLLETFTLPDGMDTILMRSLILERSGDLYPYYQVPDQLKTNINNWFTRKSPNIARMYAALTAEYNPIENYDRYEEWTDTPDLTHETQESGQDKQSATAGQGSVTQNSGTDTITDTVSAYNSSTYQPDSKAQTEHGLKQTVTRNGTDTGTTEYGKKTTETNTGNTKHDGHLHGNIGVTTNQQMIEAELELRKYDLYETIAGWFEDEFIVQIY